MPLRFLEEAARQPVTLVGQAASSGPTILATFSWLVGPLTRLFTPRLTHARLVARAYSPWAEHHRTLFAITRSAV
jgi:hypothetical protein